MLIDQYRQMHEAGHFQGGSLKAHVPAIRKLIDDTAATSLLDYGCGKASLYLEDPFPMCSLALYDPAVPGLDRKPEGRFHGVICTDVAEHLEEETVPAFLDELFGYATRFVFLSICTRPAKKTLPDGRNCHLTVRPREWWLERIGNRNIRTEIAWHD